MRKLREPKNINPRRDFIKRGDCSQCNSADVSVVFHHPQRGRPYTICNRCSHRTWVAVGAANIEHWMKTGRQTEWIPRTNPDGTRRERRPRHENGGGPPRLPHKSRTQSETD